jgi:hypothetical protein
MWSDHHSNQRILRPRQDQWGRSSMVDMLCSYPQTPSMDWDTYVCMRHRK